MKPAAIAFLLLMVPVLGAEEKPDYSDFARLIHSKISPLVPPQVEIKSDWGKTVPLPANLRLPRARRTVIVTDRGLEAPDGPWKRTKVWIDDPAKSVQIRIAELRRLDNEKSRLVLEATVTVRGERERQQWARGIKLLNLTVQADAVVAATFETDLAIKIVQNKFPPEVQVTPKVVATKLELKQFDLNRVGPVLLGTKEARDLGEELKGSLQEMMRDHEKQVTEKLNEAIAKGIENGQGRLSAATLLQLNLGQKK